MECWASDINGGRDAGQDKEAGIVCLVCFAGLGVREERGREVMSLWIWREGNIFNSPFFN